MKKFIVIVLSLVLCLSLHASEENDMVAALAGAIAAEMSGEPFVVRAAYGEMLLSSGKIENAAYRAPSESDMRAAAAAYCGFGFSGGAKNVAKWNRIENTPLEMRSGVRLYDWYFYI